MLHVEELYRQAREGAILLTPNLRSARRLRSDLSELDRANSTSMGFVPVTEQVLHWRGWTAHLWQQLLLHGHEDRALLQPLQERLLWEQLLQDDSAVESTGALTDLCLSAASLAYRYRIDAALLAQASRRETDDAIRFAEWFRALQRHGERQRLLPSAALDMALANHAENGNLSVPTKLVLCHLHDLHPAQQHLLDVLSKRGVPLIHAPFSPHVNSQPPALLRCEDADGELHAITAFLKEALHSPQRPDIAVIVPDLSTARDRLERALREHLPTGPEQTFHEERQPLWEFATGRPLVATAAIVDALRLLRWTVQELDTTDLSTLLRTPYLHWPVSAEEAALLDIRLLRRRTPLRGTWSPHAAASVLHEHHPKLADALVKRTTSWPNLRQASAAFTHFSDLARRILRDFGWPGVRSRTSLEFQAISRWETLLDALAALDLVAPPATWTEFLARLTTAARDTAFARENTGAPIQFLTPEESTGLQADQIWVLHADEARWSPRLHPHPLLPRSLQRAHGVPGSEPTHDVDRVRGQIAAIAQSAPTVTFSFAAQSMEGEQRPYAIIEELPGIERRYNEHAGVLPQLTAAAMLHEFEDGALLPLAPAHPAVPVRGGVGILQSQAACAFRAFAEQRLGSAALDDKDLGMDARDRGSLLHRALQFFWTDVGGSEALHTLIATGRLEDEIRRAVHRALPLNAEQRQAWELSYAAIQRERLEALLHQWLRMESERPAFRIAGLEQELTVQVGPLPLRVRVDRIDEVTLPSGETRRVILDYKSGDQTAKKWEGDRPDEPQLPLYATANDTGDEGETAHPVGAIAFALVRPGDGLGFRTLPYKTDLIFADEKAKDTSLQPNLEEWRHTLLSLAEDFATGIAAVHPKDYPTTCKFCDQRLLCRLNPELLIDMSDSEDDA